MGHSEACRMLNGDAGARVSASCLLGMSWKGKVADASFESLCIERLEAPQEMCWLLGESRVTIPEQQDGEEKGELAEVGLLFGPEP